MYIILSIEDYHDPSTMGMPIHHRGVQGFHSHVVTISWVDAPRCPIFSQDLHKSLCFLAGWAVLRENEHYVGPTQAVNANWPGVDVGVGKVKSLKIGSWVLLWSDIQCLEHWCGASQSRFATAGFEFRQGPHLTMGFLPMNPACECHSEGVGEEGIWRFSMVLCELSYLWIYIP